MDPETLAQMARVYAYRLERGYDPVGARAYLRQRYPFADQNQIRQAVYHAQRAIDVGERMRGLQQNQPLSVALGRRIPPNERVGVRVHVWVTRPRRFRSEEQESEQQFTVYLNLRWDDPRSAVDDAVLAYVKEAQSRYGRTLNVYWDFAGPTWWPAGYP